MAITVVTRQGKGSKLTVQEFDANITNLAAAIENTSTGHDHDGTDSKKVIAANIVNTPSGTIAATDVQAAINELGTEKVQANTGITSATKTKITYDAKGLVTAGADTTTADIADSADRRYCTDAQKTVIGNTSGANSGDETAARIGALINGATAKTAPVDTDMIGLMDSAASNIIKKFSWANIKATLVTYFKTLFWDRRIITIQVIDGSTTLTTGDGKAYVRIPTELNGYNIISVAASLIQVASTSGMPTVQIARGRQSAATTVHAYSDILSTLLTIDATEWDSRHATTAAVINTSYDDLATGDLLRIDVDVAGTGAQGLTVTIIAQLP